MAFTQIEGIWFDEIHYPTDEITKYLTSVEQGSKALNTMAKTLKFYTCKSEDYPAKPPKMDKFKVDDSLS